MAGTGGWVDARGVRKQRHATLPIGRTARIAFEIEAMRAACSRAEETEFIKSVITNMLSIAVINITITSSIKVKAHFLSGDCFRHSIPKFIMD